MAVFKEAPELKEMAQKLIMSQDLVDHIDIGEVLFLKEFETMPKSVAKCYALKDNPIQYFTDKRFCIVFYESKIDYFTQDQRAILLLHELMHIPMTGDKLVDHDVKDFYQVLQLGIDWNQPGAMVPKLINDSNNENKKETGKG